MQNETEFDRYEPCRGYDREEESDNQKTSSYGLPYHENWREHLNDEEDRNFDNPKLQPTCYICGLVGHV